MIRVLVVPERNTRSVAEKIRIGNYAADKIVFEMEKY